MELMIRIRKDLKHEYDPLMEKFNSIDTTQSRKIHKKYVFDSLKELGVKDLTPGDEGILLMGIKDEKDMVLYLELVHKIFPIFNDKTGSIIDSLDGLVEQIK
jgi:hypothetical protein